ncbi:MAG: hypothetical protein ACOYB1_15295 [Limnohabitans sp.]
MDLFFRISNALKLDLALSAQPRRGRQLSLWVDGQRLRVASPTHELLVTPEALGTAFSIPLWSQGRRMACPAMDGTWLENNQNAARLVQSWWGYPPAHWRVTRSLPPSPSGLNRTGLAFSLGVDSLYSCFYADPRPDLLVLVGGFDVPWQDRAVLDRMAASTQDIARALGMQWALVQTDLRQHALFRRVSWEKSYGAAVAFVGASLTPYIHRLLISSGMYHKDLMPHGSHPDLDPLWSSSRLQVQHVGHELTRLEKMERLIDQPLSRDMFKKHLRVCWEHPSSQGNCGQCAKCTLVRLSLLKLGAGFVPDTMPEHKPLDLLLSQLPPIMDHAALAYRRELLGLQDKKVDATLRGYIERSERAIASSSRELTSKIRFR